MTDLYTLNENKKTSLVSQDAVNASIETRETAAIQSAYVMAKKFPRDESQSHNRILSACKRLKMAESATYSYPRGDSMIVGASIRLAEMLAQNWGNISWGVDELSREGDTSMGVAYAIDLETNAISRKMFTVKHVRVYKDSQRTLKNERDIRENFYNIGSRILRSCILQVIPPDIVEDALEQAQKTLSSNGSLEEQVKKALAALESMGVTQDMIESKFKKKTSEMVNSDIVSLRGAYTAIRDGYATAQSIFGEEEGQDSASEIIDELIEE